MPKTEKPLLTLDVYLDGEPCRIMERPDVAHIILDGEILTVRDRSACWVAMYGRDEPIRFDTTVQPVRLEVRND